MNMLLKILMGAAEGPLIEYGQEGLRKWLEAQYAKYPKRTAMLVSILHAGLKGEAEQLVKSTKTNIDDDVVDAAINELESFAAKHGFTLTTFPEETETTGQGDAGADTGATESQPSAESGNATPTTE